ncbi:MAG: HNH endonuclease [Patescibacteria group bacterium]|jgi:5-methylcytosine-specific restriction endonuclease McrA
MKTPEEIKSYHREQHKKWISEHREYKRKSNAQWETNNKEKVNSIKKKWRKNNIEKIREIDNKYYTKNPSTKIKAVIKYYHKNRDKKLLYSKQYYFKNFDREQKRHISYYQTYKQKRRIMYQASKLPSQLYRFTSEYEKWRQLVYSKANLECEQCGTKGMMCAHHIKSASKYPELRYDPNNGACLCVSCHKKLHRGYGANSRDEFPLSFAQ